jgi:hypothetical protein
LLVYGGYPWGGDAKVVNNAFSLNSANVGGAVYNENSHPLFKNNICWNDSADIGPEFHNEWGFPVIYYCDIQGGWPGTGNIDIDPLFRDPDNGVFHLMSIACGDSADSPCIDAGDPNILDSLLDCSWGLGGTRSDMGAYGGGDSLITGISNNIPLLPDQFILLQNYPNPFNARTTIRFILPESQTVQLSIYDLLGRQVETLIDEYKQAGVHSVAFNASNCASGIYFARLEIAGTSKSIKMLLLK